MSLILKEKLRQKIDEYQRTICKVFHLPADAEFPEDHFEKIIDEAQEADIKKYIEFLDKQIAELHKTPR